MSLTADEFEIIDRVHDGVKLLPTLSQRQRTVLQLISGGATNNQIGSRLRIANATVENHVKDLKYKLGVESRSLLAVIGYVMVVSSAPDEGSQFH